MQDYLVEWAINLTAETRVEAVEQAVEMLRDPMSTATVFHVTDESDVMIDIDRDTPVGRDVSDNVRHHLCALMLLRDREAEGRASVEDLLDAIARLERYVQA